MWWAFDLIKSWANILKEAGKIDEYKEILDLLVKEREQEDEIRELKNENRQLKEDLEIKGKIIFKNNFYYVEDIGPYCSKCRDDEKKLIRSHPTYIWSNYAKCPKCESALNYTWRESNDGVVSQELF